MPFLSHRTKIVATIGPASNSIETIREMAIAGMSVARLNFSHGSYADHAKTIQLLRQVSAEFDTPITILQDLQGPKIRVGHLPNGAINLQKGDRLYLVPFNEYNNLPETISIDYPYLAEEVKEDDRILLDDGLLEFCVEAIKEKAVLCKVIEGGILKSRKGVNVPSSSLRLSSLTKKDEQDIEFGAIHGVDVVALSFVREADDIRRLKGLLAAHNSDAPVIAKIEKPQAIFNLDEIMSECDGLMVARGDLGVEMSPEKVPMLQKQIIKKCNQRCIPVITATQMLDSMVNNPRPTRAEASDVANAIVDGTDAVMLSAESAAGKYPVKSIEMLARIAIDVEGEIEFNNNYPPNDNDETHALSEALKNIDSILSLKCIATFTSSGYTALIASGERPKAPVVAFTPDRKVYHRLNLIWGVKPVLIDRQVESFEELVYQAEESLLQRDLAFAGDKILIMAGIPTQKVRGTNFLKIHTVSAC
jgi:pyruvate kinase